MTSPRRTIYPDRWLVLSQDVFRTIRDEPAAADGLYRLRLDTGLVEQVDFDLLARHIQKLARAGIGSIHVVVDELDAQTMERLMPLARDDIDIQLHDWFESPSDVLMSLGAPDQAVVDVLQQARLDSEQATLEVASPAYLSDELAVRYVAAQPAWEKTARQQWGEEFGRRYPQFKKTLIPWGGVVEARPPPVRLEVAATVASALLAGAIRFVGKWARGLVAQVHPLPGAAWDGVRAAGGIGAMHPLGAAGFHAAGEPAAPLDFDFNEAGIAATVSFEFADQPVRLCRAYVAWSGEQLPDRLTLRFAAPSFDLELSLSRDAWVRSGERQLLTVRLEDPVGALRAWLAHLHAVAGPPTLIAERD